MLSPTGFIHFWAFQIPWLPMTFSKKDLKSSYPFWKLSKSFLFSGIFGHLLVCSLFCSCFGTCNNLPTTHTIIFQDFPWPKLTFHDFLGLETEILIINPMTFLVFHDLYEPCSRILPGPLVENDAEWWRLSPLRMACKTTKGQQNWVKQWQEFHQH